MNNDASNELEERLRRFYGSQPRSDDALREARAALRADPDAADRPARPSNARAFRWRTAAVLTVCVLLAVAAGVWGLLPSDTPGPVRQMAAEIVLNHRKQLAPEVNTDRFADLSARMKKLDFTPVAPERIHGDGYGLEGARYCSIGGTIAAQVHLDGPSGERCTLYQFRRKGEAPPVEDTEVVVENHRVRLWREGEIVHGLVCSGA